MNKIELDKALSGLHKLFIRNAHYQKYFLSFNISDRYAMESFIERIKGLGFSYRNGMWEAEDIIEKDLLKKLRLIKKFILSNRATIQVECTSQIRSKTVTI